MNKRSMGMADPPAGWRAAAVFGPATASDDDAPHLTTNCIVTHY